MDLATIDDDPFSNEERHTVLKSFKSGRVECEDVVEDMSKILEVDTVKFRRSPKRLKSKPEGIVYFEAACPRSFEDKGGQEQRCSDETASWHCFQCLKQASNCAVLMYHEMMNLYFSWRSVLVAIFTATAAESRSPSACSDASRRTTDLTSYPTRRRH